MIGAAWQQFGNISLSIAVARCQPLARSECEKPPKIDVCHMLANAVNEMQPLADRLRLRQKN
jgi:hypothetical protein